MHKSTLTNQIRGIENRISNFVVLMNLFTISHIDQYSREILDEELGDIRMALQNIRLRLSCSTGEMK